MRLIIQWIIYKILIVIIGILLLVAGITDCRKKQISRKMLLVLLLVCCVAMPLKKNSTILDAVGGLAIGLCILVVSIMTREQIGKGDGMVIAAIGLALGVHKCFLVVCVALFVMCVLAVLILIFRRGNRQTRLPFLPAIFAGYLLCFLL